MFAVLHNPMVGCALIKQLLDIVIMLHLGLADPVLLGLIIQLWIPRLRDTTISEAFG